MTPQQFQTKKFDSSKDEFSPTIGESGSVNISQDYQKSLESRIQKLEDIFDKDQLDVRIDKILKKNRTIVTFEVVWEFLKWITFTAIIGGLILLLDLWNNN